MRIFWFRRDLRLEDNRGLAAALKQSAEDGIPVQCLFIFDRNILEKLEDKDDARLHFIHETLVDLNKELQSHGSSLLTFYSKPLDVFKELITEGKLQSVYTNHDYEPYAIERDHDVSQLLKKHSVDFHTFKDQVIFEKSEVVKNDGKPYTVFTPYKNRWLSLFDEKQIRPVQTKKYFPHLIQKKSHKVIPLKEMGFKESSIEIPGRVISKKILEVYDKQRDFPAIDGTSKLGIHLRFGTLSPRKAMAVAIKTNKTWQSELIWREFFMQILFHFPHVVQGAFRSQYDAIPWRNDKKDFKAWCQGKTGYPLVDAGMRELNETGYMHNRVRMLVASFLTKHLLIDWRWGEAYFARKLLDFELSANNGNWQWAAGTGCDAAPYFRIFNPETQIKKFDKDLQYIRTWVPELDSPEYPEPIVDHKFARERALETYKKALNKD